MRITIGYVLSKHKVEVLKLAELNAYEQRGYTFRSIPIDPTIDLTCQERCDVIFHKIHDVLVDEKNYTDKRAVYNQIEKFTAQARLLKTVLLDRWSQIEVLTSRVKCAEIIQNLEFELNGVTVASPKTFLYDAPLKNESFLEALASHSISFPFLAKPTGGVLARSRYDMSIHFANECPGYRNVVDQLSNSVPCVIQQFFNHGGVLYKLYVIGDYYGVSVRPSIVDLDNTSDAIFFKSNHISRIYGTCGVTSSSVPPSNLKSLLGPSNVPTSLDMEVIGELVKRFKEKVYLELVGLDIIHHIPSNTYYVVDINYLPGFKGIPDVRSKLVDVFIKVHNASLNNGYA
ncbi:Inositol-tetrakisphosphate 1-kinase [Thelohanellus kitauei]|uniref:Inositol-tetrakisphosphate 1-kinase n=1 Tax=Thelohanellus kitauei TaxID=669202 RepID=A0A0C2JN35_THEKT|nr:Inositol-tetrakisphosphate 1-kinase [Thelohanellus kitauei]